MAWDLSCPDWQQRLVEGRSLVPTLPLYPAGDVGVAAFNKLKLHDVHDQPTMAEAGADWFRDIVRALFGSVDPITRQRYIREIFVLVSKKNNKTSGGALLMLTALLLNRRPSAAFLMTGPFQKTMETAFMAASMAIELDPVLQKKLWIQDHMNKITHRETGATLEIITFDPAIITGQKVSGGCLLDELHVIGKMPKANKTMTQIRGGLLPFPEAFLLTITTQSDDPPTGVFLDDLTKARGVRDGKLQSLTLPVLYEFPLAIQADPDMPWKNPELWHQVNPNMGLSVHKPDLIQLYNDAIEKGEGELRIWASQHLNIEIGLSLHAGRWAGAEFWQQCAGEITSLDELLRRSEVVTVGIDGGGLDDLLGLCVLGREAGTGKWLHWAYAWAHEIVLTRRKEIRTKLEEFQKAGHLTIVQKPGDDVKAVGAIVRRIKQQGLLPDEFCIGVDAVGIGDIYIELTSGESPLDHKQISAVPQGWKLNGAIKTWGRKLAGKEVEHEDSPLMAWCVGNAKETPVGNAVAITKQVSGSAKIDPLMATFNAGELMMRNPPAARKKFQVIVV